MESEPKGVPLEQLPPNALMTLKKQLEDEMMVLAQSLEQFKSAFAKFEDSKNIIKEFGDENNRNKETLIPMTSSVYVPGVIEDNSNLLVDFGTGYYVERNVSQTMEYCARKAQLIKDNMENLTNTINQKGRFVDSITLTLQRKIAQMQQQQAQAPTPQ